MGHQDGRPQVENLFAREITPNLQLLCWDKPSDPTVLAYQVWASDSLDEKRPELGIMDERHIYLGSFPDFGDGRHWLRVTMTSRQIPTRLSTSGRSTRNATAIRRRTRISPPTMPSALTPDGV